MENTEDLWKQIFGEMWSSLIATDSQLGGFLLNPADRTFRIDDNVKKMLSLGEDITYDQLEQILKQLAGDMKMHSPVKVYYYNQPEGGVTAGMIRVDKQGETVLSEIFSMSSQTQLVHRMMSDQNGDSMLAFIKLEGIPQSYYGARYVQSAMNAIVQELPEEAMIAANTKNMFWLFVPGVKGIDMQLKLLQRMRKAVEKCVVTDKFGVRLALSHDMTITAGTAGASRIPTERMHTANYALYEALGIGAGSIMHFRKEQYEAESSGYMEMRKFTMLIEENRFLYHFQPIVSVETGGIIAYEALMRTDEGIGMGPADILRLAERSGRMYDIEYATMFNVMEYLNEHQIELEGRKVFINSISGYRLTDDDFEKLTYTYGELLEKVVVELTEQSESSDADLRCIQQRLKENRMQMAIDDYGTGYSNTSNLLRYNPVIVKIDRSLITGIDTNAKTRKLVETLVTLLHDGGYVVLAEGVETTEELQVMIMLGADLIQGFYTARPRPFLLHEVSDSVQKEIAEYRSKVSGEHQKIYHPQPGEIVNLENLLPMKYTGIYVETDQVTFVGNEGKLYNLPISVKDDIECEIHFRNVGIGTPYEFGTVSLGHNTKLHLILEGNNTLDAKGIYVPGSAEFILSGSGNLNIRAEQLNCYAIGTPASDSYGSIIVDMIGNLRITVNGDNVVGIGGGRAGENGSIRILGGDIGIVCHGRKCVAIGGFGENTSINVENVQMNLELSSPNSVGIGTFGGNLSLFMRNFLTQIDCSGHNLTAVGAEQEGRGTIDCANGKLFITLRGRRLICVGTEGGSLNCEMAKTEMAFRCEGDDAVGIGDKAGSGDIILKEAGVEMDFTVGKYEGIVTKTGNMSFVGGSRRITAN